MSKKIFLKPRITKTADNLVQETHVQEIYEHLMSPVYSCIGLSNHDDQFPFWVVRLSNEDINNTPAFLKLWQIIDESICRGKYEPYHTLVNANNFGDCPMVHTDLPADRSDDCYTIIYYAHNNWDCNWSGETVILNDARNEIIGSVYPRPGRIFVFDSALPHVARAPTRICSQVRLTVAFRVKPKSA